MSERTDKYFVDIQIAIENIENFTFGITSFVDYVNDLKTQSAVERQLVIIGEALNKIKKSNDEYLFLIEHNHQIIGFRNRLVHAYDSIDNSIVWAILKLHLPKLKEEINKYI